MESPICRKLRLEGQREGRLEQAHKVVLTTLEVRFGAEVANDFAAAVNAVDGLSRLKELHCLAILCHDPDEFDRGIPPRKTRRRR